MRHGHVARARYRYCPQSTRYVLPAGTTPLVCFALALFGLFPTRVPEQLYVHREKRVRPRFRPHIGLGLGSSEIATVSLTNSG